MRKTGLLGLIAACCMLCGCEVPISIKLPHHDQTCVIEGWIENGQPAVVVISLSRPYYSKTTADSILACIQTEAAVTVTDSNTGESERLKLGVSSDHVYGLLGKAYIGKQLKGVLGHTYLLHVENKGKVYDASTCIPVQGVQMDTLYFSRPTLPESYIRILFSDPKDEFNCYRFFTKVKGEDPVFSQVYIGTFDDLTFNGLKLNFELTRSPFSNIISMYYNTLDDAKSSTMYQRGSTVFIKSCTTDEATKNYWFALQVDLTLGSNLFMSPATYPTNLQEKNGSSVTGIWSGYHARYDTLVFKTEKNK